MPDRYQTPQCCQYAKIFIRLTFPTYYVDRSDYFKITKPFWVIHKSRPVDETLEQFIGNPDREIHFCPFCGKPLPDLKLKDHPPEKVVTITDGGYYCDTCKERLCNCTCYPPESLWEIIAET